MLDMLGQFSGGEPVCLRTWQYIWGHHVMWVDPYLVQIRWSQALSLTDGLLHTWQGLFWLRSYLPSWGHIIWVELMSFGWFCFSSVISSGLCLGMFNHTQCSVCAPAWSLRITTVLVFFCVQILSADPYRISLIIGVALSCCHPHSTRISHYWSQVYLWGLLPWRSSYQEMLDWCDCTSLTEVCGFLGLCSIVRILFKVCETCQTAGCLDKGGHGGS